MPTLPEKVRPDVAFVSAHANTYCRTALLVCSVLQRIRPALPFFKAQRKKAVPMQRLPENVRLAVEFNGALVNTECRTALPVRSLRNGILLALPSFKARRKKVYQCDVPENVRPAFKLKGALATKFRRTALPV